MALPGEIVEEILTLHVDSFDFDPTYQWTQLRRLSRHQKHRIEKHIRDYWLTRLLVTIYADCHFCLEYRLDLVKPTLSGSDATNASSDVVVFFADCRSQIGPYYLDQREPIWWKKHWEVYDFENPYAFMSLGTGVINNRFTQGYLISDAELVDLVIGPSDTRSEVRFNWFKTLDNLFWEEMFMRELKDKWLEKLSTEWRLENDHVGPIPNNVLLELMRKHIQWQRRVRNRRQRTHTRNQRNGTNLTAVFHEASQHLHLQTPNKTAPEGENWRNPQRRTIPPDNFEIILYEESMIPSLPAFPDIDKDELIDLRSDEKEWEWCTWAGLDPTKNSRWAEEELECHRDFVRCNPPSRDYDTLLRNERYDIFN